MCASGREKDLNAMRAMDEPHRHSTCSREARLFNCCFCPGVAGDSRIRILGGWIDISDSFGAGFGLAAGDTTWHGCSCEVCPDLVLPLMLIEPTCLQPWREFRAGRTFCILGIFDVCYSLTRAWLNLPPNHPLVQSVAPPRCCSAEEQGTPIEFQTLGRLMLL